MNEPTAREAAFQLSVAREALRENARRKRGRPDLNADGRAILEDTERVLDALDALEAELTALKGVVRYLMSANIGNITDPDNELGWDFTLDNQMYLDGPQTALVQAVLSDRGGEK